jgi:hypothetical protein
MSDDGNTAVIGKYVFVRSDDSWQQQADLVADDGGDGFGASAAVSNDGNTAVIGDPSDSASDSAAYVFARSGESWTEEAKLAAATSDSGFYFGESADISGDGSTVIIGDITGKSSNGKRTGAAHVFALSGGEWQEQARLAASDGDQDDRFGARVGLSSDGNTAIIGSDADKTIDGEYAGSAYVCSRSDKNWEQQTKLSADDGDSEDFFGTSVGISGDGSTAIACAHRDEDPNGENAGSAYVFTRSGEDWTQKTKLAPADGDSNDRFGYTVDLSADGDTAIFGAYWDDDPNGEKAGSAYVFTRSGGSWSETAKLAPEDSGAGDALGYSIGVSSDGTPALVAGGSSAYLFELVS